MFKDKKIIKSSFFLFLIFTILFTTLFVSAAIMIYANQVSFSSSKTSETTIQGALDELYKSIDEIEKYESQCPDGLTCTKCSAGTYSPNGENSCISCPTGYTSDTGAKNENECYINTTDGKYIATAKSSTQTECPSGYYCLSEKVYYGQTGGKKQCPTGYTYSVPGATAISNCVMTTTAGKYVATAKSSTQTECPAGYYCMSSKVNYGNKGVTSICPPNYYCPAGSSSPTKCATGYESEAGSSSCKRSTYTYTKTGYTGWVGTYTCKNGTATITGCSNNGTVCNGGSKGSSYATYMCTLSSKDRNYTAKYCSTSITGVINAYGGGLPETESCS